MLATDRSTTSPRTGTPTSGTARPAPARAGDGRWRMSPRLRRTMLTLHVAISVAWLGLDVGLLALGITGLTTRDPETLKAAYLAMDVFGDVLIIPVSLGALSTGVLLSLGTQWGFFRYYWVLAKFVITVGAATASIFALRGTIAEAAAAVRGVPVAALAGVDLSAVELGLVFAPSFAFTLYTFMTVLSVFKPWGRTPYGRRVAARSRTARAAVRTG
jgi:hypothetical protein